MHPTQTTAAPLWPMCPSCRSTDTASDWSDRRHHCLACEHRWTEAPPAYISGTITTPPSAPLDRARLLSLIARSRRELRPDVERAAQILRDSIDRASDALVSRRDAVALAVLGVGLEVARAELTRDDARRLFDLAYQLGRWHVLETGGAPSDLFVQLGLEQAREAART